MSDAPKCFPATCSDADLENYMARLSAGHPNPAAMVMLQISHNEIQNREVRRQARDSSRIAYIALAISVFFTALAAWFASNSAASSAESQKQQILLLSTFLDETGAMKRELENLRTVSEKLRVELLGAQRGSRPEKARR
jgi:hypothetical protein